MNPAAILIGLFDWRGVLSRAAYRRNLSILVLVNVLIDRLGLLHGLADYGFIAVVTAIGLSLDARRYHDAGRSAAWIVWTGVIFAVVAIVIFQFLPNILDNIPLPNSLREIPEGEVVLGRFAVPALIGVVIGNIAQSLFLAMAPSMGGPNPFAAAPVVRAAPNDGEPEVGEAAAAQALIERHLAMRREAERKAVAAPARTPGAGAQEAARAPAALAGGRRTFGKRVSTSGS